MTLLHWLILLNNHMLLDAKDESIVPLWERLNQVIQDAKKWPKEIYEDEKKYKSRLSAAFELALCVPGTPDSLFDDAEPTLLRAYINNVGRQPVPEAPKEEVEIRNLVPEETKDYWRGLYRRDDCSSNQEAIYHEALAYAEQGDPYAMFIVGYLLNHGIETKYSHPNITILKCDHEKALHIISQKEGSRASFYNYYTGRKWGDSANYDLCINSSLLGIEGTERFIAQYIRERKLSEVRS